MRLADSTRRLGHRRRVDERQFFYRHHLENQQLNYLFTDYGRPAQQGGHNQ